MQHDIIRPRAFTYRETAAILNVSPSTVAQRVKRGDIASFRIGKSRRVPEAEIERLLRDGIQPHAPVAP